LSIICRPSGTAYLSPGLKRYKTLASGRSNTITPSRMLSRLARSSLSSSSSLLPSYTTSTLRLFSDTPAPPEPTNDEIMENVRNRVAHGNRTGRRRLMLGLASSSGCSCAAFSLVACDGWPRSNVVKSEHKLACCGTIPCQQSNNPNPRPSFPFFSFSFSFSFSPRNDYFSLR